MKTLEHEVKALLERYHDDIFRVVDAGVKRWKGLVEAGLPTYGKSIRPQVIHGIMMEEARKAFEGVRNVAIVDEPFGAQRSVFNFHGEVVVAFKQVNKNLLRSNIRTQTVMFADLEGWLPHVGPNSLVTAGYQFDALELEPRVFIVRETNRRCDWWYQLDPPASSRIIPFVPGNRAEGEKLHEQQLPLIPRTPEGVVENAATSEEK